MDRERPRWIALRPIGSPSSSTKAEPHAPAATAARRPVVLPGSPLERRGSASVQATPNGISSGGWMPAFATRSARAARRRSAGAGRGARSGCAARRAARRLRAASRTGVGRVMGGRRYTPAMGAVETMEDFFEKLNGAIARARSRSWTRRPRCASTSATTSRRCAAWSGSAAGSCAATPGCKMIPGEIRDTGQHLRGGPAGRPTGRAEPAHRRHVPRRGRQDHRDQHRAPLAHGASGAVARPAPTARAAGARDLLRTAAG